MSRPHPHDLEADEVKPLLRGWSHAVAALAALLATVALFRSSDDRARALSMLVFGISMVELYAVSAIYHIGRWRPATYRVLRALDHSNIFVLIAGTYTPICFNVLDGSLRVTMLAVMWSLALLGIALAVLARIPRWLAAALYVGMGWVGVVTLPRFADLLPWQPIALIVLGGVLYTIGAVIYARRRPDPYPRVFGFHEVFHLFVIGGSVAFAVAIWMWVLPFPRAGAS